VHPTATFHAPPIAVPVDDCIDVHRRTQRFSEVSFRVIAVTEERVSILSWNTSRCGLDTSEEDRAPARHNAFPIGVCFRTNDPAYPYMRLTLPSRDPPLMLHHDDGSIFPPLVPIVTALLEIPKISNPYAGYTVSMESFTDSECTQPDETLEEFGTFLPIPHPSSFRLGDCTHTNPEHGHAPSSFRFDAIRVNGTLEMSTKILLLLTWNSPQCSGTPIRMFPAHIGCYPTGDTAHPYMRLTAPSRDPPHVPILEGQIGQPLAYSFNGKDDDLWIMLSDVDIEGKSYQELEPMSHRIYATSNNV